MNALAIVDVWLLLGALIQLVGVLRARNFYLRDWILPVAALLGGSLAWFFFIYLCSNAFGPVGPGIGPAADAFIVGFAGAVCFGAIYVSAFAPMRLNCATLLSLTISFWAVYATGGAAHKWLVPAVVMTFAAALFAAGLGRRSLPFRAALQIWSLLAAALVAWSAIPASVGKVLGDYRVEELAHTLGALEVLVTGAQAFLFAQMGTGVIMLMFEETWSGWLPDGEDESLRWPVLAALVVQAAALVLLRGAGGAARGDAMALAVFAALAHGAMTGPDAKKRHPKVDVSFEPYRGR